MPQLPTISVVTPWLILGVISGCVMQIRSSCVCTSMNPGATTRPVTSMIRSAANLRQVADGDDGVAAERHVGGKGGLAACHR